MTGTNHNQDIGVLIKLIHDRLETLANKQLGKFGLTLSQVRVLVFLHSRCGQVSSPKDIQEHLKVSHPTVVGLLSRLENKGFVRCEVDARDRRAKNVFLTSKEKLVNASMGKSKDEMEQKITSGLDETEIALLRRMLAVVYKNIENES